MSYAVGVLGAGSFGTALAIQLARRGAPTVLWGRDPQRAEAMQADRRNATYLPDCPLPAKLDVTADLAATVAGSDDLLIATPSYALRQTLQALRPLLRPGQGIATACKGLEPQTSLLIHEVIAQELGDEVALAVISGPTFAKELALGMPTAVTIASGDEAFAEKMARHLHGDGFRAYWTSDLPGVEIGGAAKNVMAIGVGIADGLGLGANTRAALITRGMAEIMRLADALGAQAETLMGLAGMGDLVLTCTDNQSRNRRMGLLLAQGKSVDEATQEIRQVVEGVRAAPEVSRLAQRLGIEMPITSAVCAVLDGTMTAIEAVRALATRPAKHELG
ncbi:NAD(P)-dependent glycerol-3-phosphate dehydrogenase [Sinimarinibacterium sp. CAU 1509]|uniref:NAD(P)H-dependent glycerol-3-phosphate dehydrogenase n=1 Tax=Sinimarinibacterium sp. CAU 1509 TaxID=2562283 RepID=UPI0010ABF4EE|nr:NAD(P)H-dependent glycerol-3-phosphate dehydrogenase [Sinimarinibacterium sp. CAU 1509]TJY64818.1 NAD(P)-dependent glycerol-3-phosphate dehydrogenase [Sinimarinibacterium sp. CAU 1509]